MTLKVTDNQYGRLI